MSFEKLDKTFQIINEFSRQLSLIKSQADFDGIISSTFSDFLPGISRYALFSYNWSSRSNNLVCSNYFYEEGLDVKNDQLHEFFTEFQKDPNGIYNQDIDRERLGEGIKALNNVDSGSEFIFPIVPVNEPTGVFYLYSPKKKYFDANKQSMIYLMGNMSARTLNYINFQTQQIRNYKKTEQKIINQKNLMDEIFDYLPINIFTMDEEGKFIYVNKNTEESTGLNVNSIIGKTLFDIYPKHVAKELDKENEEIRKTRSPILSQHEIEIDKNIRYVYTGKKIITTTEKKEWLIGFSLDITQNILANKNLESQKQFFQQIIDTDPNFIFVRNKEGKFLLVNQAMAELFHSSKEKIIAKGLENISFPKGDEEKNRLIEKEVISTQRTIEYEEMLRYPNGEELWLHTTKKPLPEKDGTINVLGISVDITHRKKHSDELLKAKKAKEQFLANMSHEIRTPINGIVGMINLLEEMPTTTEQRKYLNAIKTSSENLKVIINDILDLSAIESGNLKFEKIGFKPKELLNTLLNSFIYSAQEKGLQLTLNLDPYIDEILIGDPVRLNQIISNLMGNAIKFTKKGYVKIYALKISEEKKVGTFQFIVEDSGIGIAKDKIESVFENFEQGDPTITRKYGGTGLGLAIVKRLVEIQGGSIEVESNTGSGTKFSILLKYAIGKSQLEDILTPETSREPAITQITDFSNFKLLLVEDNEVNILYTKKILDKWNCVPDEARNGLIALQKLKENNYDLILMDVRMPVMDGFEATKFIRNNLKPPKSAVPIIALTANAIKGDDEKCLDAGMDDYISKPFQPDILKEKLLKFLGIKQEPEASDNTSDEYIEQINNITDLTYLKEMSDNDQPFITGMIDTFINQTPKDLENIWFHFSNKEFDDVANLVHKIKPSITFMGIHSLKDMIPVIEENAKNKQEIVLKDQLTKLEEICKLAILELKEELENLKENLP